MPNGRIFETSIWLLAGLTRMAQHRSKRSKNKQKEAKTTKNNQQHTITKKIRNKKQQRSIVNKMAESLRQAYDYWQDFSKTKARLQ